MGYKYQYDKIPETTEPSGVYTTTENIQMTLGVEFAPFRLPGTQVLRTQAVFTLLFSNSILIMRRKVIRTHFL